MFYDATISQIVLLAAGAVLLTAAGEDFLDFFISNRLVLALIGLYPIYVFTTGGSVDWLGGVLVALAVLAVGIFLFAFNWIGGGDVKLMAAVSLGAGPTLIASFLMLTAVAGGVLALTMISYWRVSALVPILPRIFAISEAHGRRKMAYGVAIAAGGLFVITQRFVA